MSRIGKLPVAIPSGVTVNIGKDNLVTVKGPKGELQQQVNPDLVVKVEENQLTVERPSESKGQMLEMSLGYSHNIFFELPNEVKVEAVTERRSNPRLTLESCDKQLVGHVAAKIRSLRKPEPYKGKGIKFKGEELRRKAGKSASA